MWVEKCLAVSKVNLGRVMVLGSRGMVGSACVRELRVNSQVSAVIPLNRDQLDLTDQAATFECIFSERPDWVIIAGAKVGGIHANATYPADFVYQNIAIQNNVIEGCRRAGVEKLIFLGSSCIYPKHCSQPIKEEYLLTGPLEPTNEPYAVAKIAGIKMCESYNRQFGTDYRSLMPTNLYGLGDNYHPTNSHVIPSLIRRFHEAKLKCDGKVTVWGTGKVRREFMLVDDLAKAILFIMSVPKEKIGEITTQGCPHLNVGSGEDVTILELAEKIRSVTSFEGDIEFDESMPDGTPQKLLSCTKLRKLGWRPSTSLDDGLTEVYESFVALED